jgi:hypothetical protein
LISFSIQLNFLISSEEIPLDEGIQKAQRIFAFLFFFALYVDLPLQGEGKKKTQNKRRA